MATNLPLKNIEDSAAASKLFFDVYGQFPLEFPANDVEASIGFFQAAGFDRDAAIVVSSTLLKQAKLDGTPIFTILDTVKKLSSLELSALVGEILNNNRPSTSTLGFRVVEISKANQTRNISV
jgi:hypothetical protein